MKGKLGWSWSNWMVGVNWVKGVSFTTLHGSDWFIGFHLLCLTIIVMFEQEVKA